MRKRRAAILGVICFLCLGALGAGKYLEEERKSLQTMACTESALGTVLVQDTSFLQGKEKRTALENPGVCFEEVLLPYDAERELVYLPQSLTVKSWTGSLSAADGEDGEAWFLYAAADPYWQDKEVAIRENHRFTLWLVGESSYYELGLVCPGMPVIAIDTERSEEPDKGNPEVDPDKYYYDSETLYYGTILVLNPGVGSGSYEIVQSNVRYHLKGASTLGFEKKGYALSLQDYRGENADASLLGMRSDNSWKLNALNTDVNRIREITASQIWEQFDQANTEIAEPGPRMEYTELIMDHEYRGLYCLVEPVDEKKLELDRNDVLYKAIAEFPPGNAEIQVSVDRGWKVQYSLRIRHPKEITDYAAAWRPVMDYLGIFYENPELDYDTASSRVELSNLEDMFMFLMATSASDNVFKNTYFAADVAGDGTYVMRQLPWDLDYTFGNCYEYNVLNSVRFDEDYTVVYAETALPRLKGERPEEIGPHFLRRWTEYREGFLSTEEMLSLLKENRQYIMDTGAVARETERWPEAAVSMEIDYLLEYQEKRMEWLDDFFEEWAQ